MALIKSFNIFLTSTWNYPTVVSNLLALFILNVSVGEFALVFAYLGKGETQFTSYMICCLFLKDSRLKAENLRIYAS